MEISQEAIESLVARARQARQRAYAPYSHYAVGAALLTASGEVFEGVNVENAAYPAGICAERAAVFAAVSAGHRQFAALAVVTQNAGSPCGSCRQVLAEFGTDTAVVLADPSGRIARQTTVAELLPHAFGPGDLEAAG
jgi:cytidine deaminase